MNLLLKQRLVGAAVIIALGVVIIPMLLDGSGSRIIQEIPDRPARQSVSGKGIVENQTIPTPAKRAESAVDYDMESSAKKAPSAKADIQKKKVAPVTGVTKTPIKKTISEPPVTKSQASQKLASWVVQIGSFNEKGKALKLRDQFRAKGFSVFMEPFQNANNKSMYRVRVGPVQDRSQAETLLKQLKKKTGLANGYVTQHP